MGGVANAAVDLIKDSTKIFTSSERELMKSEGGKLIHDALKDMSGEVSKVAEQIHQTHINWFNTGRTTTKPDPNSALDMAKTLVMPRYLGNQKQVLTQGVNLAGHQRNPIHAKNVADIASIFLRETGSQAWRGKINSVHDVRSASPYTSSSDLEKGVKNFMGWTLLGRVAIPHSTQFINTMLNDGLSAFTKAAYDMAKDYNGAKQYAHMTGALFDETLQEYRNGMTGQSSWLTKLFHMPAFANVRKFQIIHAATAGKYAAIDAAGKYARNGSKEAELSLKFFGLDPAAVRQAGGRLTQDMVDKAAYESVNQSFFLRDLKTPWLWQQNPTNRLLFLYKNFQFREGKTIINAIGRGLKGGPISAAKTIGILGTAFPLAGEVVSWMENAATGHGTERKIPHWTGNPEADRVLDDLAHVAGFGIWYSIARSTGYKQLLSYFAGPVFSTLDEEAEGAIAAAKGNVRPLERTNLRRVPVIGSYLTNKFLPPASKHKSTHSLKLRRKLSPSD